MSGAADTFYSFPSSQRCEPGSVNIAAEPWPAAFDTTAVNPDEAAVAVVDRLNWGLHAKDKASLSSLFLESSYWRDHLCASWDLRTLKGPVGISNFLASSEGPSITHVHIDRSKPHRAPGLAPINAAAGGDVQVVQFFVDVKTTVGTGQGLLRLTKGGDGSWKIITCYTVLRDLTTMEEPRSRRRPRGKEYDGLAGRQTWLENRQVEMNGDKREPAVLIVGAGQGGLSAAARLKMLDVETLVVDRIDRVGDNWRNRYRRLILHDPVWIDHMPYLEFPDSWPIFTPKDKLGDFFEAYANLLELNVWTKTELVSSTWDDATKRWTVVLERKVPKTTVSEDGSESRTTWTKETRTFHPRHVIQATGHSGKKNFPSEIPGISSNAFKGKTLCHSADFPGAQPNSQGKKAVVVGSCNSGHDLAQDFYEHGYDVTMLQRSSTTVISSASVTDIALKGLYDEEGLESGINCDDADLINFSMPGGYWKQDKIDVAAKQFELDKGLLTKLRKAGFGCDIGPDHGGLLAKYYQRGGGYYIDVGASGLIIDGKIKMRHGVEVAEVVADGLKLTDGSHLPADEVVFATGYGNMRTQSRAIFGDALADRVNDVWGLDAEGEFRAMWRPSGHPGFWFMGGNLVLCRYFSSLLALQIKAREAGLVA